ncbi:VOC family protein [Jatrophihabitans sp. DSM 45814]
MDVLGSRILLRPRDAERSQAFYREVLGLAIAREFGPPEHRGLVFFLGPSLLEVTPGNADAPGLNPDGIALWLQVRDVRAERERLVASGVSVRREPRREPWGLIEMWIDDPDGVQIVLVEIPADHPLRKDQR